MGFHLLKERFACKGFYPRITVGGKMAEMRVFMRSVYEELTLRSVMNHGAHE